MIISLNGVDIGNWEFDLLDPHTSMAGPQFEYTVPEGLKKRHLRVLEISLQVTGHPEWDSVYELPVINFNKSSLI